LPNLWNVPFRFSESYSDRRGKRGEEKLELT